jgi:hypothetical protein
MGVERAKRSDVPQVTTAMLEMKLVGAYAKARVKGEGELPGKSNYFIGNDPKKWRTNIATYAKVRMEDVYPGVDLVYYGNQGRLEYDFVVQPGADPSVIRLALGSRTGERAAGSERSPKTNIDGNGDLVAAVDGGEVRFHKPVVYQPSSADAQSVAERIPVSGRFTVNAKREVAFVIPEYDRTKPLVIDPVLAYSTYLGGGAFNWGNAIAVDGSGNAYVTGGFNRPLDQCNAVCLPFPTTPGAFETSAKYYQALAFVAKVNAEGTTLLYSTWLGGPGLSEGRGIAVDGSGNAYVTGGAGPGFPTTSNAFQAANPKANNGRNAFVTKLNTDGSALVYSTYLGGSNAPLSSGGEQGNSVTVDANGNAYVTGYATSTDFPTSTTAFQPANHSPQTNAFVTRLSPDGSAIVYSSYLGGSGSACTGCGTVGDMGTGIGIDGSGSAYVVGHTFSTDFPTTPNAVQPVDPGVSGSLEGFIAKVRTDGSALIYSSYLGGSGGALANGIAVDSSGNAYITGGAGQGFPTTAGAFQATLPEGGFVTKLNPDGSALVYSTYLGGTNGPSGANSIAVDSAGAAYVTGATRSTDFPIANAIQAINRGQIDAFVTELSPDGSTLIYSTYLGGSLDDSGSGIVVDASGNTYVAGYTYSNDFPVDSPVQPVNLGFANVFVSKISPLLNLTVPATP